MNEPTATHSLKWNIDSSPFAKYIGTNDFPSDTEMKDVRTLLENPLRELDTLDREIEGIQRTLAGLLEKRARLATFINEHLSLTSLVRRLPDEVLSAIFAACLPKTITFSRTEAPLLLTWVCHQWREVALATPGLWSMFHVAIPLQPMFATVYDALPPDRLERLVNLRRSAFREWTNRAKGRLLCLSVDEFAEGKGMIGFENDGATIAEPLLRPVSLRIHSLTISDAPHAIRISGVDFHELRSLSIPFNAIDHQRLGQDDILCAPRLEDVTITMGITVSVKRLPLRWAQLTRLSLTFSLPDGARFTDEDLCDLFDACKLLEWLDIRVTETSSPYGTSYHSEDLLLTSKGRMVYSANLRHLHLSDNPAISGDIFQYLSLPALSELSTTIFRAVDSFMPQFSLSLHRLAMAVDWCTSQELLRLLSVLKYLESLSIERAETWRWVVGEDYGFTDEVLKALTPSPTPSSGSVYEAEGHRDRYETLCPLLTTLEVNHSSSKQDFSIDAIVSFVQGKNGNREGQQRDPSVAKLRRLKLFSENVRNHVGRRDLEARLERYVKDGLELKLPEFIPEVICYPLLAGAPLDDG